jgi:hypothetical protein
MRAQEGARPRCPLERWSIHQEVRVKIRFGVGLGADTGPDQLAGLAAGLIKFVIRPAGRTAIDFVNRFVAELLPRQN